MSSENQVSPDAAYPWAGLIQQQNNRITKLRDQLPQGQETSPELIEAFKIAQLLTTAQLQAAASSPDAPRQDATLENANIWQRIMLNDPSVTQPQKPTMTMQHHERGWDCAISPDKVVFSKSATINPELPNAAMLHIKTAWHGAKISVQGDFGFKQLSWAIAQTHDVDVTNFRLKGQDGLLKNAMLKQAHAIIAKYETLPPPQSEDVPKSANPQKFTGFFGRLRNLRRPGQGT